MARQAYSSTIDIAFDYNGQRENISSDKIIYVMIEHDYENKVIPIIYLSLAVNDDLYTKIIKILQNFILIFVIKILIIIYHYQKRLLLGHLTICLLILILTIENL